MWGTIELATCNNEFYSVGNKKMKEENEEKKAKTNNMGNVEFK